MEDLLKSIKDEMEVLKLNLTKYETGNNSAGARARKSTLNLEKLFKQYRKDSIEASKKAAN